MYNRAILLGRFTKDPELTTTTNGISVAKFTLAVDRKFKKEGEDRQADFISCVAWRQSAEFICKYFHKGDPILVEGSIQTRNYENKEGQKVYVTEVIVDSCSFTGSKSNNSNSNTPATDTLPNGSDFLPGAPLDEEDLPF